MALSGCECGPAPGARDGDVGTSRRPVPKKSEPKLAEAEPNNSESRATAFRFVPQAPGSPLFEKLVGTLEGPDDIDWVRIPAQAERPVRTLTVASEGDVALRWPGARDATTDLGGVGEAETVQNLSGPAVVTVAVVAGAKADKFPLAYTVEISRGSLGVGLEAEAGGAEKTELTFPGEAQGLFNYRADQDDWTLSVPEGVLRFEYAPPASTRSTLKIGKDGNVFDVIEVEAGEVPRPLVRPNLVAGDYTISVKLETDAPGVAAAYALRVLAHPAVAEGTALDVEPSSVDAPVAMGANPKVLGYLHDKGDKDRFLRVVEEPQTPEGATDPVPWVLRAGLPDGLTGVRFAVENEGDAVPAGTGRVCNRIVKPGKLVVDVDASGKGEPEYPVRYEVDVTLRPAKDEEIEPNHRRAKATGVSYGAALRGFLHPVGDKDFWSFVVEAPKEVKKDTAGLDNLVKGAGLAPTPGAGLQTIEVLLTAPEVDADVEIVDEDGAPVARANATGLGGTEKLKLDLPAGKYFVVIKPVGAGSAACGEPYTLHVHKR